MSTRTTILNDASRVLESAKAANRALTSEERTSVRAALDRVKQIDAQADAKSGDELRQRLADVMRDGPVDGKTGLWSAKAATTAIAGRIGQKALAPSGAEVAPAGLTDRTPVALGRVAPSLLAVVAATVVTDPPTYAYLRQTTRQNNAAAVADGALKPTSVYGITRVEDRLRVLAHLSEAIPKAWLEDSEELRVFLDGQMAEGLEDAVERALLSGDGTGENPRGMLATSGIQTQAWSTDGHETIRKALTKAQAAGAGEIVVALHPTDFEAMALVRSTTGAFLGTDAVTASGSGGSMSPPVSASLLASWGASVVLSNALTAGQGVVFDPTAVTLYTDGNVSVEWNTSIGFTKNEVIARCEGRFGVAVKRPLSVVNVDMSAAA